MQKEKKLSIECVNRVKLEKVEEFKDSIFSDVYRNAHMQIERILDTADMWTEDREAEAFCVGNDVSNVIAFVGERGMGKSSAMLSFAYFLKKYPGNMRGADCETFRFKREDIAFYTLSKIDVAILTKESLFDVVLARMWTSFHEKLEKLGESSYEFSRTKESFNSIKNAYTLYYTDEKQNRNLTSVRQLQELSRSLALREEFARLTASFLECMIMGDKSAVKKRFLVIPIDDLDLASEKTIDILEQLRIFLSVPQVIILTTVDVEKLLMCGNKKFSDELLCSNNMEENEKWLARRYSEQYIAKVLPRNSRISMPRYGGTVTVKYILDDKYLSALLQKETSVEYFYFINIVIAKHLNLIIRHRDDLNPVGESLRNIVNKLNELWIICRDHQDQTVDFVFEWLEKEIAISRKLFYEGDSLMLMKDLDTASQANYNEYIINWLEEEPRADKMGYGQVLCAILDAREENYQERDLLRILVLLYSLQLAKCVDQRDGKTLAEAFVRDDIFSSFISRKVRFKFEMRRRIDTWLYLNLIYEEKNEKKTDSAADIMERNAQQITNLFKLFLFCEVEAVLDSVKLGITFHSGGTKEISEGEIREDLSAEPGADEEALVEIRTRGAVCKISVDLFFKNAMQYEELYRKYIFWIYGQLKEYMTQNKIKKKREPQPDALYDRLLSASNNGVEEIRQWKATYGIAEIYDLFPVQNVGVMLGVLDRLKRTGSRWSGIDQMMEGISRAFAEEFGDAEDECHYEELGYRRYSEKLETLLKCIDLGSVPPEMKNRLVILGLNLEDTTKIR